MEGTARPQAAAECGMRDAARTDVLDVGGMVWVACHPDCTRIRRVDEMEVPYNAHRPILRSASLFPAGTSPFAVSKQTSITADPR